MYRLLFLVGGLCISVFSFGQHTALPHSHDPAREDRVRHHRIAILIGHTHIPALQNGRGFLIPSWGLDYEYWFTRSWGVGLHSDLELQTFLIERSESEEIEREYPIVVTLDALYKPWRGLVIQLGPGYEFEKNKNFFLIRAGLEYEIDLPHHWDLSPSVFYDTRIDAYDTWSIALGVGKRF